MLGLLAYVIGLIGTFVMVPIVLVWLVAAAVHHLRTRKDARACLVPVAILCGYIGGAMAVWNVRPSDWKLPLSETFAASVNAAKYGHPIEHYAEVILVWMAFAAVLGAIVAGGATAMALKRRSRVARVPG